MKELLWSDYIYATNSYFVTIKVSKADTKNKIMGPFIVKYNVLCWLYACARVGSTSLFFLAHALANFNTWNYDAEELKRESSPESSQDQGSCATGQDPDRSAASLL